jgi:nucleoside-diphosphate-sugar epimerase
MIFTVIGGHGFIGKALVQELRRRNFVVCVPSKSDMTYINQPLGNIIYAAGITGDFRTRPFDTLDAHVGTLGAILKRATYDSLLYLSSTRIYKHSESTQEETTFNIDPTQLDDYYDITKIHGEAICHATKNNKVRIVRLSNVLGPDYESQNFIYEIIRSTWLEGHINLRSPGSYARDYVVLEDAINLIIEIALFGSRSCYNVASGKNVTNAQVVKLVASESKATYSIDTSGDSTQSPSISIQRVVNEFGFIPRDTLTEIRSLTKGFRTENAEN